MKIFFCFAKCVQNEDEPGGKEIGCCFGLRNGGVLATSDQIFPTLPTGRLL